jgi:hypothetical protein
MLPQAEQKDLHLLTMSTPNGRKVQIALEELKLIYKDISFSYELVDIRTNAQKSEEFLKVNPNGMSYFPLLSLFIIHLDHYGNNLALAELIADVVMLTLATTGRIPALIDNKCKALNNSSAPFTVMESASILLVSDQLPRKKAMSRSALLLNTRSLDQFFLENTLS